MSVQVSFGYEGRSFVHPTLSRTTYISRDEKTRRGEITFAFQMVGAGQNVIWLQHERAKASTPGLLLIELLVPLLL